MAEYHDGYPGDLGAVLNLKEQRQTILDRAAREGRELMDLEARRVDLIETELRMMGEDPRPDWLRDDGEEEEGLVC